MAYQYNTPYYGYQPMQQMQQMPQMPMAQQPTQMQQQPPQQPNNNIIWVSGEAGAKAYLVAPNNTVQLWDSENPTIYLKSADASGMPSIKILDYTVRNSGNVPQNVAQKPETVNYATHEELAALENRILEKIKEVTSV